MGGSILRWRKNGGRTHCTSGKRPRRYAHTPPQGVFGTFPNTIYIYIFQIVSWLYFAVQFWCMDGWNEIRELEGNVLSAGCCLPHPRHAEYYNVDRVDIYGCCFISNFAILAAATLLSSIWNSPLTISMTQDNRWIAKVVNLESKIVAELHK